VKKIAYGKKNKGLRNAITLKSAKGKAFINRIKGKRHGQLKTKKMKVILSVNQIAKENGSAETKLQKRIFFGDVN
jgi:hypothetical protein